MLFAFASFQSLQAQNGKESINDRTKKEVIKINGICGMCKNRIEKAALAIEGVKLAVWNEHSIQLSLTYDKFQPEIADQVQKKVAAVGHDTEKYKAEDAAYEKLPECCHYQRNNNQ